jgi:hypothetical protein
MRETTIWNTQAQSPFVSSGSLATTQSETLAPVDLLAQIADCAEQVTPTQVRQQLRHA